MIHKKLSQIPEFLAGDHTRLKEVLHPSNDQLNLGFSLAYAYLDIHEKSLPHRLAHSETYFFLEGKGEIIIDGKRTGVITNIGTGFSDLQRENYLKEDSPEYIPIGSIVSFSFMEMTKDGVPRHPVYRGIRDDI